MSKKFKDTQTPDLFEQVFPIRKPVAKIDSVTLSGRISRLVSLILKENRQSREQIAAAMSEMLDCPNFSKAMLDNYSSESNVGHKITLERFIVLIRVTDAFWAWDELLKEDGYTVLFEKEALLAERARVDQEIEELKQYRKELKSLGPVQIRRRK